ncbi:MULTISPECIES: flagellar basal body P-ring formation chaperone FlgA [Rhizobiaceae]|jgi:flagellar basal body P-ring formation protein FlgA|uniref:Flagella basal body P-ring formation protein FlgA n=1 Tax=Aliirhizobium cellulosilyticum TaxID=393664 RepID=A0A7W6TE97_9HYPH|nr:MULTISPECIES: flagellar basal body P-ring formation chaperone FlgA [Rhizobium/Agrobacterium group]MBB4348680.1 flagella basal body P-ring formation protein FlgA [Rhizobium cellulosilyticum]MBB4411916.1 flagella basal body P-ring formation protein FlgA [Rhizobium cellulosilyticum]MBB4446607.1 flagella basal body P-ring formation protein FlgA [Rhizobium cellulosilyticum]MBO0140271.1 flagellar basal body P-ring formation protein FlgA [Agrobacterium sp. Ap1]
MMFPSVNALRSAVGGAILSLLFIAGAGSQVAVAQPLYAVVPTSTIFPGDIISSSQVMEVEVTNPNLAGGYTSSVTDVIGKVAKRTLVAGRTIPVSSLREPYTIERGKAIRIMFNVGGLTISAAGSALQDAMTGDSIRVRNTESGVTVTGVVRADGNVEVVQK